jgi:VanZ family protein
LTIHGFFCLLVVKTEKVETRRNTQVWQRVWRYGPVLAWMGFIFFASTGEFSASNTSRIIGPLLRWVFPEISEESLALAHLITRKTAHFIEYAILAWLAARAFSTSSREALRRHWFLSSLVLVALCALVDEYLQSFVPSRTGSIYDSLLDMSGGLTALLLYARIKARRSSRGFNQKATS